MLKRGDTQVIFKRTKQENSHFNFENGKGLVTDFGIIFLYLYGEKYL
jgi:hypothetical protein